MGTIRVNESGPAYEDDGLSSDDELESDADSPEPLAPVRLSPPGHIDLPPAAPPVQLLTPSATPLPQSPSSPGFFPRLLTRKIGSRRNSADVATLASIATAATTPPDAETPTPTAGGGDASVTPTQGSVTPTAVVSAVPASKKRPKFQRGWSTNKKAEYSLLQQQDVVGIVMLEIQGAEDLPKIRNSEYHLCLNPPTPPRAPRTCDLITVLWKQ